ncbi:MAG TPA: hypothetical protein VMG12_38205 [Polyangiaceae bacterium]|nr:hypothetical protein [Polyangiaceae bacterium]
MPLPSAARALLLLNVAACSARDLGPLHDGIPGLGGTGDGSGASPDAGGVTPLGGTSGIGGHGGTLNGAGGAPATGDFGPWSFDSDDDTSNGEWTVYTARTTLGWTAQGQTAPLGSLVIDGSADREREVIHNLAATPGAPRMGDAVDLTGYTFGIVARSASEETQLELFTLETSYMRLAGSANTLGTDWTTIVLDMSSQDPTNPTYQAAQTMTLGIKTGPGEVWIDRVWLLNDTASSAEGQ